MLWFGLSDESGGFGVVGTREMDLTEGPAADLITVVSYGSIVGKAFTNMASREDGGQLASLAGRWAQLILSILRCVLSIFAYHESDR